MRYKRESCIPSNPLIDEVLAVRPRAHAAKTTQNSLAVWMDTAIERPFTGEAVTILSKSLPWSGSAGRNARVSITWITNVFCSDCGGFKNFFVLLLPHSLVAAAWMLVGSRVVAVRRWWRKSPQQAASLERCNMWPRDGGRSSLFRSGGGGGRQDGPLESLRTLHDASHFRHAQKRIHVGCRLMCAAHCTLYLKSSTTKMKQLIDSIPAAGQNIGEFTKMYAS